MLSHFLRAVQKTTVTPTYTYNAFVADTVDRTTYTFTAVDIGTASSTRLVVVTVQGRGNPLANRTISSATIGGVSATLVSNQSGGNPSAIISAVVTTGTTADVVITWSAGMSICIIGSYSLYDLASNTATQTRTDNTWSSGKAEVSLPVENNGIVIGGVSSTTSSSASWSNLNENYDSLQEGRTYSSASKQMTSTAASYNISVTIGANSAGVLAVAHWR